MVAVKQRNMKVSYLYYPITLASLSLEIRSHFLCLLS